MVAKVPRPTVSNPSGMMRRVLVVSLAVLALAGCSGGGTVTQTPPPDFGCPSKTVADSQAKLVSPAPGSSGVSPTIGSITLAYGDAGVVNFGVYLTPNDGSAGVWAGFSPPQNLPPSGVVTFPLPALKSGTTYTVTGQNLNMAHLICFTTVTANFGSFTTR
jgi:hypothetical protein